MTNHVTACDKFDEANAVRLRRNQAVREAVDAERAKNATPETLRHKQAVVANCLFANGLFTAEQRMAANEIGSVFGAITTQLFARVPRYGAQPGSVSTPDWHPGLLTAYHDRYAPWRDEAGLQPVRGSTTVADAVFLVAVDNLGLRQSANQLRIDQRKLLGIWRESLYRYGELAGWYCKNKNA